LTQQPDFSNYYYIMDAEKQSIDSVADRKHYAAPSTCPSAIKYLRAAQHTFAVIAISFIACAIDRNRQVPGITGEEKALLASVRHLTHAKTSSFN
jgi:hypothetical protein